MPLACHAKATVSLVTGASNEHRASSPAILGLVATAGGFFVAGPVGGAVGLIAGVLAARNVRAVLVGAVGALFLAALFTLVEGPLGEPDISAFPGNHPLANLAGAIAAVCLLAGLLGMFAKRDHSVARMPAERPAGESQRLSISAIVAVLAATFLGALALALLADQLWRAAALGLAVLALGLTFGLILARRLGKLSL